MKRKLIQIKEILVNYIHIVEYDIDSIEYLIDTIDYLLQDKIPCTYSIINVIMEDVMIASTYHKSKELLDVVSILKDICDSLIEQEQIQI